MNYVPAEMLDALREAQEALMPDACTILLPGTARTAQGGVVETEGTVGTAPCRLTVIQPAEALRGGAVVSAPQIVITLPWDAAVNEKHRLLTGGVRYNVTGTNAGVTFKTATLVEVEPMKARAG